ncbi:hypothetical protein HYV89_04775 [Candidatus Woesearchaeota archaeon]|nr:hypothetical protein [Candidatus Woesearchaeota archaeon]
MKFLGKNTIKLDKELNELDKFVLDFIKILKKHTDYVIISGYVSLLFGRARGTEDIDVFIEEATKESFIKLYQEIEEKYWCLNSDEVNEIYSYLKDGLPIRVAIKDQAIPNFEIKFAKTLLAKEAFKDSVIVKTTLGELKISSLERQIAFKKYYLKSDKDLEDAKHIEKLFKENINYNKVKEYRITIENAKTKNR